MDQYATGNVQFPGYQAPGLPPLNAPDFNIHTGDPSSYYNPAPSTSGGANWQNGYGAGGGYSQGGGGYGGGDSMTPSMTTLNPGPSYTPPDWSTYLNAPDLTIKTDNGGGNPNGGGQNVGQHMGGGSTSPTGHTTNGGGGMYTSGTLGGGSVVDPSAWGMFGIGGSDAGDTASIKARTSTGMGESGGGFGTMASFLAGRRVPRGVIPPRTGGGGQISG
jgi:hypothetical protein